MVPYSKLGGSQEITQNNVRLFKENDLDIHKNEVVDITDDHDAEVRRYKVRKVKYFDMGKRG